MVRRRRAEVAGDGGGKESVGTCQLTPSWIDTTWSETRSRSSPTLRWAVLHIFSLLWYLTSRVQSQGSSLAQKIQFLEAKGLTPAEIEDALRQAPLSNAARANASYPQPVYGPMPYQLAQPPPGQWDWRDYFVWHTGIRTPHCSG
jgi:hypothetical protein